MTEPLTYLYAVVPAAAGAPHVAGVDAEPPRIVVEGELGAVVGSVAPERFDEDGLAAGLEDLGRLEELARAHHGVVAALADDGPVAPVRLATVFRVDEDAFTRAVAEGSTAAGDAIQIVPTGPWPPFSFATVADR